MSAFASSAAGSGPPDVKLRVAPGELGVQLIPDSGNRAAVVHEFNRLPSGQMGAVQKAGTVKVGDVLVAVNETRCDRMAFRDVMALVQGSG